MYDVINILKEHFPLLELEESTFPSSILISSKDLVAVCQELHQNEQLYFDMLSCITGIDNGVEAGTMEVIYNLYSISNEVSLMLKVSLTRNNTDEPMPSLPTVSHLWKTAEWHEREIYDLLGIEFSDHPDMRRILMPADWQGHPLRKDYQDMERYRGMSVVYDRDGDEYTKEE